MHLLNINKDKFSYLKKINSKTETSKIKKLIKDMRLK